MDKRLFEAVRTGNVDCLQQLIDSEPLILNNVALTCTDSPLHIACLANHLNIVHLLLRSRKEFAQELNQDGLSPLHIAAAGGYAQIVKELLKVDPGLCLVKGRENRLPLHYATIKGRVVITKDLLSASLVSIEVVTSRGETALHLAVKSNQFDVLCVLVEHVLRHSKFDVLNKKDRQGNNILHIAAVNKQLEVIDHLLNRNSATSSVLEVNALNKMGCTPLDVFQMLQSEVGDREIEDIIRKAGGVKAKDIGGVPSHDHNQLRTENRTGEQITSTSLPPRLLDFFKYNMETDSPNDARNVLLIITVLIAAATFQAGTSFAGLLKEHDYGSRMMMMIRCCSIGLFLFFNSLGFFTSLHMIYILTSGFPMQFELLLCMISVAVTYTASFIAQLLTIAIHQIFAIIVMGLAFLIVIILVFARTISRKKPRDGSGGDFRHLDRTFSLIL